MKNWKTTYNCSTLMRYYLYRKSFYGQLAPKFITLLFARSRISWKGISSNAPTYSRSEVDEMQSKLGGVSMNTEARSQIVNTELVLVC